MHYINESNNNIDLSKMLHSVRLKINNINKFSKCT